MHEHLRFPSAKLLSATVSRAADHWYVGINLELKNLDHLKPGENRGRVGLDLGIKHMVVLSDGRYFDAPKPLRENLDKLKRLQKQLARCELGSNNRAELRSRIGRLHERIANIRRDALDKVTTYIASHYSVVVMEDLNVKGMAANHRLALSILDVGFGEFRRQLEYKMQLRGGELIVADRWFPSSRLCRFCHEKNEALTLADREWTCPRCGRFIADRDLNAALNLFHYPETWGELCSSEHGAPSASSADFAPSTEACQERLCRPEAALPCEA